MNNKQCHLCDGPLVHMIGEGKAICADCKTEHTFTMPEKADSARAKKRSTRLGGDKE